MIFKKKLSKKELLLWQVSIAVVLIIAADGLIRKAKTAFARLDKEISLSEAQVLKMQSVIGNKGMLESTYATINPGSATIKDADGFLKTIARYAKSSGLNIRNMKANAVQEKGLFKVYSVEIESQQPVMSLAKFLDVLNEEVKGVGIERLQISAQNQKELPKAILTVNAVTFEQ
ncbi:MAG: hypothetical protein WDL87_05080 [Candidatus Omnitrophota bacterium]|jgi:hypothetical protein